MAMMERLNFSTDRLTAIAEQLKKLTMVCPVYNIAVCKQD